MAGSRSKRRLLDLYVAIALMDWVDMADPPDVMAQKVTKILRDDWDVAEDLTRFVEPLIPEIFKRLWANDDGLMTRASQKQGDYGPDELADFIAATAWQLREEQAPERSLLEQLIAATKLYDSGEAIKELFAFTIRLREFAPFNAMLLHIQKPGLTHAATAQDWHKRFGRVPKKGARPLLILRTKGPVDFVFDILDTEGRDVPVDAFAFPTFGNLTDNRFTEFMQSVKKERIDVVVLDAGDGQAGWIRLLAASKAKTGKNLYQLAYNRNHDAATRFVTVAHELAHLYLGHLGLDAGRRVPDRRDTPHALMEVEAEMAAYLVAMRNGLKPRSESYLANYKGAFEDLNLYAVTRAANAVETAMGISAQKLWNEKA